MHYIGTKRSCAMLLFFAFAFFLMTASHADNGDISDQDSQLFYLLKIRYLKGDYEYLKGIVRLNPKIHDSTPGGHVAELRDRSGKVLTRYFFRSGPGIILWDGVNPKTGKIDRGGKKTINESNSILKIPYYENGYEIVVFNKHNSEVLRFRVDNLNVIKPMELTRSSVLNSEDLTGNDLPLMDIRIGDTKEKVYSILGRPDIVDSNKSNWEGYSDIVKDDKGYTDIAIRYNVNNRVFSISIFPIFNDYLKGDIHFGIRKERFKSCNVSKRRLWDSFKWDRPVEFKKNIWEEAAMITILPGVRFYYYGDRLLRIELITEWLKF